MSAGLRGGFFLVCVFELLNQIVQYSGTSTKAKSNHCTLWIREVCKEWVLEELPLLCSDTGISS